VEKLDDVVYLDITKLFADDRDSSMHLKKALCASVYASKEMLDIFAKSESEDLVREVIYASARNIPLLHTMAVHSSVAVRKAVASVVSLAPDVVELLLADEVCSVRLELALNADIERYALKRLANDVNPDVSDAAENSLRSGFFE
jgi:hypothetical protein